MRMCPVVFWNATNRADLAFRTGVGVLPPSEPPRPPSIIRVPKQIAGAL